MFDFHEKRKIRGVLYSKPVIALLLVVAGLMSVSVYHRYQVAQDMHGKLRERQAELEKLQLRAETLDAKVQYLEGERGIEEELRNRFDVVKEGEQVVIILDDSAEKDGKATEEEVEQKPTQDQPWFSFLKFW